MVLQELIAFSATNVTLFLFVQYNFIINFFPNDKINQISTFSWEYFLINPLLVIILEKSVSSKFTFFFFNFQIYTLPSFFIRAPFRREEIVLAELILFKNNRTIEFESKSI